MDPELKNHLFSKKIRELNGKIEHLMNYINKLEHDIYTKSEEIDALTEYAEQLTDDKNDLQNYIDMLTFTQ